MITNTTRIEAFDGFGTTVNVDDDPFIGIRMKGHKKLVMGEEIQRAIICNAHVTVADMNNDGQKRYRHHQLGRHLCVQQQRRFNSGSQSDRAGWHHLRKRGFASLADILMATQGRGYYKLPAPAL